VGVVSDRFVWGGGRRETENKTLPKLFAKTLPSGMTRRLPPRRNITPRVIHGTRSSVHHPAHHTLSDRERNHLSSPVS
jgi:hypothetical protein